MVMPKLSEGCLSVIMNGGQYENAVLQVLGSKKIPSATSGDKERCRLLLSDGINLISSAMLSTQMITKVFGSGELSMYTVIKVNRYITSVINNAGNKNKRILILLEIDLVESGEKVGQKIGEPAQLSESDNVNPTTSNSNGNSSNYNSYNNKPTTEPNVNYANVSTSGLSNVSVTNPIASLSPYSNKWTLKVRVMNKGPIKTWSNSKGEGKLFSVDLCDDTGEIRATGFREVVDKFYDMLEVDKIYYISKGQIKLANKQFNILKNDYEITFSSETAIQECVEDVGNIPMAQYNFVSIDQLANHTNGDVVDVIGVCKSTSDLQTFTAKSSGKELKKVEVQLIDTSNTMVALTLWGSDAEQFNGASNPIVVVKGAKVGEFGGGKTVSVTFGSCLKINPNLPEAHKLRGWYDNGGASGEGVNISARVAGGSAQWLSIKNVQEGGICKADQPIYYQTKGMIMFLKTENMVYKACATCNKKVVDHENGMVRCEKCNREYPTFKYRLLLHVNIADYSGSIWATVFNEEAEKMMGISAEEVGRRCEDTQNQQTVQQSIANLALFKSFIFKFRAKMESYNDETRVQSTVLKIDKVPNKDYSNFLIKKIQELSGVTI